MQKQNELRKLRMVSEQQRSQTFPRFYILQYEAFTESSLNVEAKAVKKLNSVLPQSGR